MILLPLMLILAACYSLNIDLLLAYRWFNIILFILASTLVIYKTVYIYQNKIEWIVIEKIYHPLYDYIHGVKA